jgi:hypothetical protein
LLRLLHAAGCLHSLSPVAKELALLEELGTLQLRSVDNWIAAAAAGASVPPSLAHEWKQAAGLR